MFFAFAFAFLASSDSFFLAPIADPYPQEASQKSQKSSIQ
jgi:hypothetical protein